MNKVFADTGWEDYVYWQTEDRKTLKKINQLINDIVRNGNENIIANGSRSFFYA